jgi:type IV secretory pathway TraG/TraD family ATPase VirD4
VYKEYAKHIESNCIIKGYLTPNDDDTAEELSRRIGTITLKHKSQSRSWGGLFPKNENISDTKRALMLPQEILGMPDDKCLIFLKGIKPILANRIFWYTDKRLKDNEFPSPNIPLLELKQTLEIKAKMKTIDVDINDIHIPEFNKEQVLSDEESITRAELYLKEIGEIQ